MSITTTCILPPPILQHFDPYLLMGFLDRSHVRFDRLIPLSMKKIRSRDVGKRREFDKLVKEYKDIYERKKIEEENYKTERKNKKKRSSFPTEGSIARFKRMDTTN